MSFLKLFFYEINFIGFFYGVKIMYCRGRGGREQLISQSRLFIPVEINEEEARKSNQFQEHLQYICKSFLGVIFVK